MKQRRLKPCTAKSTKPPPGVYYRLSVNNRKRKGRPVHGAALIDRGKVSSLHFLQYNYSIPKTNISNIPNAQKNIFLSGLTKYITNDIL
uniref:Uncharacterized protein n=1 Tax=Myoviridae sp. ctbWL16 TaxID=2826668 RepID=A0A8S5MT10_9CAUD|nr:MAG TPA: hypothetical protein [Myoviridae sp. ctbWL16]